MGYMRHVVYGMMRRWRNSLLTLMGIAIGVCSVVVINSIGTSGTKAVSAELQGLGLSGVLISHENKSQVMTEQEIRVLQQSGLVDYVMPVNILWTTSIANSINRGNILLFGVDQGVGNVVSLEIRSGRGLLKRDLEQKASVCVVDEAMVKRLDPNQQAVGQCITITAGGRDCEFEIIGVASSGVGFIQNMMGEYAPSLVYIPYTTLQEITDTPVNQQVVVKIDELKNHDAKTYLNTLLKKYGNGNAEYAVESLAQQQDSLYGIMELVTAVLTLIGGISLLVACLNIMTTMMVAVRERTKEIGIKKSIGAGCGTILWEFLLEAVLLSGAGSLTGIIAAWLVADVVAGMSLSGWNCLIIAVITILCGGIFGVYPAYRAAVLRPIDALKAE